MSFYCEFTTWNINKTTTQSSQRC